MIQEGPQGSISLRVQGGISAHGHAPPCVPVFVYERMPGVCSRRLHLRQMGSLDLRTSAMQQLMLQHGLAGVVIYVTERLGVYYSTDPDGGQGI